MGNKKKKVSDAAVIRAHFLVNGFARSMGMVAPDVTRLDPVVLRELERAILGTDDDGESGRG